MDKEMEGMMYRVWLHLHTAPENMTMDVINMDLL